MTSKAERLADWVTLSDTRFGDCYVTIQPRGKGMPWEKIVALAPANIKLFACREAEQAGFLDALALALANWESRAGRPPEDILAIMSAVCNESGILQGMTDQQKGFMNAEILMPLVRVSQASAIVYATAPVRKALGTAFLVTPDLVLTAAHVALSIGTSDNGDYWSDTLRPDLEFKFAPRPGDPDGAWVTGRPAPGKALVSHALPHGTPPNHLDLGGGPAAGNNLDYALIRLAQRVEHVDPVEIVDTATVEQDRACWTFGFPGGTQLVMDVGKVAASDAAAGRWRHFANAAAGMSGGCCVNHEGQVVGIHEGTLEQVEDGKPVRYNRGVSISSIRKAQCRDGKDPFKQRGVSLALEFQDALRVDELYRAGLNLVPATIHEKWRAQVAAALGQDPEAPGPRPAFHPWFRRDALEKWIEGSDEAQRLCMVFGERGTGTSFAATILRAKLASGGGDLLALSSTQTRAIGWEDAISQALGAEDSAFRTTAALARYSDTDMLIEELRRRSNDRKRLRYVALDFGRPDPSFRFGETHWFNLVVALLHNRWIKVLLIGLPQSDRDILIDHLADKPATEDIKPLEVEMRHVDANEFIAYTGELAAARGLPKKREELRKFAADNLADFTGTDLAALQTTAAALAAIVFERSLK